MQIYFRVCDINLFEGRAKAKISQSPATSEKGPRENGPLAAASRSKFMNELTRKAVRGAFREASRERTACSRTREGPL